MLTNMFKKTKYATIPVKTIEKAVAKQDSENGRLNSNQRLELICDENTFIPMFENVKTLNPLSFEGYEEKISSLCEKTGFSEAVKTGECEIFGTKTCIAVMDSEFLMGSMGSVVGERLSRLFEYAEANTLPVIIFCASGGERMHEGIFSLMQMAKVSAALQKH